VRELQGWRRAVAALALGAGTALSLTPFAQPLALALCLPLLLRLGATARNVRTAALTGWLAGIGYFAVALFWLAEPFLVDIERHGWMAPFAPLLMSAGLSLFWALAFGLVRSLTRPGRGRVYALAAAWTIAEFARSTLFTGFPWALFSMGMVDTAAGQMLALVGPFGLVLLVLVLAAVTACHGLRGLASAVVALVAATGYGLWRVPEDITPRADDFTVRLVQPDADQRQKWDTAWLETFYRRLLDFSADSAADLIVWPETAVPYILSRDGDILAEIAASAAPVPVALGIRDLRGEPGEEDITNSLALLDVSGKVLGRYDKTHLVPFGEYVPFSAQLAGIGLGPLTAENLAGFSPGLEAGPIDAPNIPAFLPLICYEAIFPAEIRARRNGAEWLLQVTNDAWFGSFSGPQQHLDQARMRAIETGLPLARAANTGISAMIDPFGRVTASIPLNRPGFVDAHVPAALPPTVYARVGDWPVFFGILLIFILARRREV
jgi:apolipoprotein N-acyltransferase